MIAAVIVFFFVMIPIVLGLGLLIAMWQAWWLYPAWAWFIVPLGVRPISFWHFTALVFLVRTLTQNIDTHKDDREFNWSLTAIMFFWPVTAWVLLWWMR